MLLQVDCMRAAIKKDKYNFFIIFNIQCELVIHVLYIAKKKTMRILTIFDQNGVLVLNCFGFTQ